MYTHHVNKEAKRCRLNNLTISDREQIAWNELSNLRTKFFTNQINIDVYMSRRWTMIQFAVGETNTIDSDGVIVEFFVGPEDG